MHKPVLRGVVDGDHPKSDVVEPAVQRDAAVFQALLDCRMRTQILQLPHDIPFAQRLHECLSGKVRKLSRHGAMRRLRRALKEFVIEGVQTTIPLHQKLIEDPEFQAGDYTIKWLEEWLAESK